MSSSGNAPLDAVGLHMERLRHSFYCSEMYLFGVVPLSFEDWQKSDAEQNTPENKIKREKRKKRHRLSAKQKRARGRDARLVEVMEFSHGELARLLVMAEERYEGDNPDEFWSGAWEDYE